MRTRPPAALILLMANAHAEAKTTRERRDTDGHDYQNDRDDHRVFTTADLRARKRQCKDGERVPVALNLMV